MADLDPVTVNATKAFLDRAGHRFPITAAIVFGSRARQSHRATSDADLAVILEGEPRSFLDTKLALADIAFDAMLETGVLIQPLPIWTMQWADPRQFANPDLIETIKREGIAV